MAVDQQRLQTDQSYRADLRNQGYFVGADDSGHVYAEAGHPGGQANASGGGGGGSSAPVVSTPQTAASNLDASFQKMLQALASGNAQDFAEAQREFNQNFALSEAAVTGTYNGNPTQAAVLQQANLTGQYNGQPTEATREFNTQQQEAARQFNANLANSLLNSAIQLRGPQDYLQYQQLTHGGANLLSQLTSPNAVPQTSPSATQVRPASISDIFSALGIGGGASSNPNDAGSQLLARFGLTPGQTLNPGQINPARYDQIGSIGQALTKNLAESLGYDPTDFENRINAQRPLGTAPGLTTTTYRQPTGLF